MPRVRVSPSGSPLGSSTKAKDSQYVAISVMFSASIRISAGDGAHRARIHKPLHERRRRLHLPIHDPPELLFDGAVAREKLVQIAVEEPIFEDRLEHQMEEEPDILGVGGARFRRDERAFDLAAELFEQVFDDLLFRGVVVIEVAVAHAGIGRDGRTL